jgi:hypothetical protein
MDRSVLDCCSGGKRIPPINKALPEDFARNRLAFVHYLNIQSLIDFTGSLETMKIIKTFSLVFCAVKCTSASFNVWNVQGGANRGDSSTTEEKYDLPGRTPNGCKPCFPSKLWGQH